MVSKDIFSSCWIMQFLEKLWRMWENIEISSLQQLMEKGIVWWENQTIINKNFSDNLLVTEMKITLIFLNKSVCLAISILEISKIIMH